MMVLKIFAIAIAVIAVSLTYMHEYHRDKILYLNSNFPAIRSSVASLHKFIIDFTPKIFLSPHTSQPSKDSADRIFAPEELLKFRGEKGSPEIYLAIFGKVFDVTKGSKHYGPGGSYHAFAGQDASRAFVTGDFSEEGLTDDVVGLSPDDLKSIQDWSLFYHEEYIFKGKLVGRYYDSNGERTEYYRKVDSLIKQALDKTAAQNADYAKYPPCNVEWSAENGSKVWCSKKSGGIERNWAGVPRKYYKPGASSYRCACIEVTEDINQRKGNIEEYEGCSFEAEYCHIRD